MNPIGPWTPFALEDEYEHFGMMRIAQWHNALRNQRDALAADSVTADLAADEIRKLRLEYEAMTRSRDDWQATAARRTANLEQYSRRAENDIAKLTRERDEWKAAAQASYGHDLEQSIRERDEWLDRCTDAQASAEIARGERDFERMRVDRIAVERANAEMERDAAKQEAVNMACAAGDYQRERDALQAVLDARPALNDGLYEAYVRWSAQVGEMEFMRAVCAES